MFLVVNISKAKKYIKPVANLLIMLALMQIEPRVAKKMTTMDAIADGYKLSFIIYIFYAVKHGILKK